MMPWYRMLLFFLILATGIAPCRPASAETQGLPHLTFLPQWSPQAQFAGFYLARQNGCYRRHGIDLTILPGGPHRLPVEALKTGSADIVTLWLSTALQLADQGVAIVNVGQLIQHSALCLAVRTRAGIIRPADMNGKKVALWPADFQIQPRAFFDKYQLDVRVVTAANPVHLFLHGGVQITSLMWYNEYHTLINAGLDSNEIRLFRFEDADLNFPEDGIYLQKTTLENHPEAVRAFVAATMEGWRDAFAHPETAIDLILSIMQAAHIPANRVHQRWMLDRMRDLMQPSPDRGAMGELNADDFRRVADILRLGGLIRTSPSYTAFFKKVDFP
ncbi:ABC transporter substrate-binding protein [Desulfosarcina ovata]|uniref:Thiamine pyrimidine synthase n=1 Tax=Desulfosarcina ovata subsp. ovata TaxID=2752305 RepID=A0A5K8AFB0_9BACT|nr:ABC transporter substrate-binding protein [Desulfosarcina ovata]BBO91335.1 nitrate ABC transporter substrate-binding protein [Desulfosarcina ovata subsp. ovata]